MMDAFAIRIIYFVAKPLPVVSAHFPNNEIHGLIKVRHRREEGSPGDVKL
jgi:hypothetical protein